MSSPAEYLALNRGWMKHATCAGDILFLDREDDDALNRCATCPVARACLAHAITTKATGVVQAGVAISDRPIRSRVWDYAP